MMDQSLLRRDGKSAMPLDDTFVESGQRLAAHITTAIHDEFVRQICALSQGAKSTANATFILEDEIMNSQ